MGNDSARVPPPFTLFLGISESCSNSSDPGLAGWPRSCAAWEDQEVQGMAHPILSSQHQREGGCKKKEPVCLIHCKLANINQKPILPSIVNINFEKKHRATNLQHEVNYFILRQGQISRGSLRHFFVFLFFSFFFLSFFYYYYYILTNFIAHFICSQITFLLLFDTSMTLFPSW